MQLTQREFIAALPDEEVQLKIVLNRLGISPSAIELKSFLLSLRDEGLIKLVDPLGSIEQNNFDYYNSIIRIKITNIGIEYLSKKTDIKIKRGDYLLRKRTVIIMIVSAIIIPLVLKIYGIPIEAFGIESCNRKKLNYTNRKIEAEILSDTSKRVKIIIGSYNDEKRAISKRLFDRLNEDLYKYDSILKLFYYPDLTVNDARRDTCVLNRLKSQLILFGDFDPSSNQVKFSFIINSFFEDNYSYNVNRQKWSAYHGPQDIDLEKEGLRDYNYVLHSILATVFFYRNEYEERLKHLLVTNSIADVAETNNALADVYLKLHKPDSAIIYLNRVFLKNSNYSLAKVNELEYLVMKKHENELVVKANEFIMRYPDLCEGWAFKGTYFMTHMAYDSAVLCLKKSLEILGSKQSDVKTAIYTNLASSYYECFRQKGESIFLNFASNFYDSAILNAWNKENYLLPYKGKIMTLVTQRNNIEAYKKAQRYLRLDSNDNDVRIFKIAAALQMNRASIIERDLFDLYKIVNDNEVTLMVAEYYRQVAFDQYVNGKTDLACENVKLFREYIKKGHGEAPEDIIEKICARGYTTSFDEESVRYLYYSIQTSRSVPLN